MCQLEDLWRSSDILPPHRECRPSAELQLNRSGSGNGWRFFPLRCSAMTSSRISSSFVPRFLRMASTNRSRCFSSSAKMVISRTTWLELSFSSSMLPMFPPTAVIALSSRPSVPISCEFTTRTIRKILFSQLILTSTIDWIPGAPNRTQAQRPVNTLASNLAHNPVEGNFPIRQPMPPGLVPYSFQYHIPQLFK